MSQIRLLPNGLAQPLPGPLLLSFLISLVVKFGPLMSSIGQIFVCFRNSFFFRSDPSIFSKLRGIRHG